DRVFGIVGGGAQAEYVALPAVHCAAVPVNLDLVAMGGVPEAFLTAHDAMVTQAHVAAGEWVLVHAIGSGVGTAALQLARALGARVVGTARTPTSSNAAEHWGSRPESNQRAPPTARSTSTRWRGRSSRRPEVVRTSRLISSAATT